MNFALNDKQGITYIDGDEFVRLGRSGWSVLKPNGKLFIGHDQDSFGGSFTAREAFVGDITQLNVWDYILNENEINEIFKGVGTETGNFLAWIDLKKFLDGPVDIKGSPVMKWTGTLRSLR